MYNKPKDNTYDFALICLISSLAAGNLGGGLQIVRIIILCLLPSTLTFFSKKIGGGKDRRKYKFLFNVCLFWIAYTVPTLLIAYDFGESSLKIAYMICHMCGMFVLFFLYEKSNNPVFSLWRGWLIMLIITFPFAIHELTTGIHHYGTVNLESRITDMYGMAINRTYAAVFFGNLNAYNIAICFSLPFIACYIVNPICDIKQYKWMNYLVFLLCCYMIVSNASRGGILVLAICIMYLFVHLKSTSSVFAFVGLFSLLIYYMIRTNAFSSIIGRLMTQGFEDTSRQDLISASLHALVDSCFLGIGVGNFQHVMRNVYHMDILAPHNLFIEVFSEFGLPILILLLLVFLKIIKRARKMAPSYIKNVLISGMILLPFTGVINSFYLTSALFWLYLGSLYALSVHDIYKRDTRFYR